jgi:hypothetical protein
MAKEGRGGRKGALDRLPVGFVKLVALVYVLLGLVLLVAGCGLLGGWWTVYDLGGGYFERSAPPGLFARLLLPTFLAAKSLADESGILFVFFGAFHLAAGAGFLLWWALGRLLLLILSGFYIFTLLIHLGNLLYYRNAPWHFPFILFAIHVLFFAALMSRPVAGKKG